jgi:hypothetical protein
MVPDLGVATEPGYCPATGSDLFARPISDIRDSFMSIIVVDNMNHPRILEWEGRRA